MVTAFSLAYAIGAPVMAVLTAGLERHRLLVVAMGGFALGNLLAALAPGYAGLLAARLLLALSAVPMARAPRVSQMREASESVLVACARSGLSSWSTG
ncbi:hypothetical protein [Bradyrhizobium brasilense]|uniref:hypothetical protein n=1 Tax=Bradyrhizobium brasilense TaxID=1419277 RepID=UPI001F1B49B8|nr:hypothetical protein [Bradyrhizobium brasilense]